MIMHNEECKTSEHYKDETERFEAVGYLYQATKLLLESDSPTNNNFGSMLYDLTNNLMSTIPKPSSLDSILDQPLTNENISDEQLDALISDFLTTEL